MGGNKMKLLLFRNTRKALSRNPPRPLNIMHICIIPGLRVTSGRGGRLREAPGGGRPPDGAAEGGVAVVFSGAVSAAGGQGRADPDRPLRLQRAIWNGSGKERTEKSSGQNNVD